MRCVPIASPDGKSFGFLCGRGQGLKTRPKCVGKTCGHAESVALCDFPPGEKDESKTCSRRICAQHRTKIGDRDYCPPHAALVGHP